MAGKHHIFDWCYTRIISQIICYELVSCVCPEISQQPCYLHIRGDLIRPAVYADYIQSVKIAVWWTSVTLRGWRTLTAFYRLDYSNSVYVDWVSTVTLLTWAFLLRKTTAASRPFVGDLSWHSWDLCSPMPPYSVLLRPIQVMFRLILKLVTSLYLNRLPSPITVFLILRITPHVEVTFDYLRPNVSILNEHQIKNSPKNIIGIIRAGLGCLFVPTQIKSKTLWA